MVNFADIRTYGKIMEGWKMRRKIATILFIAMMMQLIPGMAFIENSYADIEPRIFGIEVEQIVKVQNNAKTYSYRVIFNGLNVRAIQNILIIKDDGTVVRNIPASSLKALDDANLVAENITTLTSFFGAVLDQNIRLSLIHNGKETPVDASNTFKIPSQNLPDINRISNGLQWVNPPSWPVSVIKESGSEFQLEGSNLNGLLGYSFWIQQGSAAASKLKSYTESASDYDYKVEGNLITVYPSGNRVPIGSNMRIIFEKETDNVTMRYRLEDAINIIRPLNLGDTSLIDISPLQGTQGTLVRIKVPNYDELINPQTKVYIGGVEAKRNIIEAEGRDGTFIYDDNKKGLEVIVPEMTAGFKQIVIQNYLGDTYIHDKLFEYFDADYPRLRVEAVNPNAGPVGRRNTIDFINIRNAVAIHNLKDINQNSSVKVSIGTKDTLKYPAFKEEAGKNTDLLFLQYELEDGRFIERRISLTIGLPAEIKGIGGLPSGETLFSNLPAATDISAVTGAVGTPGPTLIRVRTETVLFHGSDPGNDLEYVVEQAPYNPTESRYYDFIADETTPIIRNIIPNQGRYDKDIVVTIEGQNFDVRHIDGKTYYPTVIIGKNQQYKVINDKGMFFSTTSDGNYSIANDNNIFYGTNQAGDLVDRTESYVKMTVLDQNGNIVDGQLRKKGTRIKLTIPGDKIRDYYSGAADVYVRNPTAQGELGTVGIRENSFEYLPKPSIEPEITDVNPSKVAVGSRERVTLTGRNFQPNLVVTVDGEIVPSPVINPAAGTIQFNAPDGRPGETFIQVINPATGGMASAPFEFIRTYSAPYIERIIPNSSGKDSLVIIKGNGFYKADPKGETVDAKIGSKIIIDNKDVNKGYKDLTGPPQPFVHPITQEEIRDVNGNPILTYGSNIAVIDDKTIYMIVPDPKDATKPFFMNEWLDVEVVNPDLGKSKLAKGFRFVDVVKKPTITSISPTLGDYRGGNIVQIEGKDFVEGVKVYFGTQEAQVYRRSNVGQTLWVYVPAYPNPLEDNNKAIVPVTVINPDSASFTKYEGYTYVNPGYTPVIKSLNPNSGNTAGGDRVLISGENFRTVTGAVYDANQSKPSVFFGGIKVDPKDVTFVLTPNDTEDGVKTSDMIVVEKTPPNPAGKVDVTVINYDGATATLKGGYEYRSRKPVITQVLPPGGSILGGTEITIIGRDFVKNGLHVVFGGEIARQDILSGQATVKLGDIIVHYNAFATDNHVKLYYKNFDPQKPDENRLRVLVEGQSGRTHSFNLPDDEFQIIEIPWKTIAEEEGEVDQRQWANERVKIALVGKELVVTRRLGVVQRVEGSERVVVKIPPAAAVGKTKLTVYNYDGTNASTDFNYTSPYRPPVITRIIPTTDVHVVDVEGIPEDISLATASPKGGSPLIIEGQNFRAGVKVFIGNKQAEIRSRSLNDDELIITVPPADPGTVGPYLRILVVNEDEGTAYGDIVPVGSNRRPYYFQYIVEGSNPVISLVDPNKGPVSGGTKITIKGKEFKDEDSLGAKKEVAVFIGGIPVPQADVKHIDYNTIEVTVPSGKVGPQTVEIVNYDYGRAIGTDAFTYISQPKVLSVNPAKLFANDTQTEVTITGKMFQQGAKVVLGGQVIKEKDIKAGMEVRATGINGVENGINNIVAVIGGVEATSVTVENEETLKVKFPEAFDLENNHIIIINPDGGVSDPYKDFNYQIPIPDKPLVLEAIPGYESTVQLIWSDSSAEVLNAADKYEIYGKQSSDRNYSFIGDTKDPQFLVRGLEASTRYDFMVRALNRYGSALEFAEVSVRTLSPKEDDKLQDKLEELEKAEDKLKREGKEEVVEGALVKTIGTEQIPSGTSSYTIDFSLSQYSKHNKFVVKLPVALVASLNRNISITDGKATFTFNPRNLYTREVIQEAAGNLEDAYVRVTFERVVGQEAERLYSAVPRNQRRGSNPYSIDFDLQVGKNTTTIRQMLQTGSLLIQFDGRAYPNVDSSKLFIGKYDPSKHEFTRQRSGTMGTVQEPAKFMLLADR